uniref:4-alpha-glucanotransferase n=1 Tax=Elaeis guineensis var. tenera TaxID=51953 RepID=A0A8N4EUP7_ELAGV|nr:4-alpha-glucanotransferase, chloroplastic/amyloplastic isoform X2 [Elaeis guineensis]
MESVLSLVMVVFYGLLFCPGWCETYHHVFYVKEASYTRLCGTKKMMTVNGQFPGPTLYANRGDELVIKVFNYAHCILWCHLQSFGKINILAEDLGVITEDVVQLRKAIGAPGMAVLHFWKWLRQSHLPRNHEQDQVVYTGTHDNDTILGWWEKIWRRKRSVIFFLFLLLQVDELIN